LNRRVLVTGATGFIGSKLVSALLAEEYDVTVLVRASKSASRYSWRNLVNLIETDLTNDLSLMSAVKSESFSTVLHLAAVVRRISRRISKDEYFKVNVMGTYNICQLCVSKGAKRMVFLSTADVHGSIPRNRTPINERYPYCPTDAYSKTKTMAEKLVMRFWQEKGLNAIILRPTHVYGPNDPGFIPKMFELVRYLPSVPIIGDGRTLKHFVYIDDLTNLILNAIDSKVSGRAYLVADDTPLTISDFLRLLCEAQSVKRSFIRIPLAENIANILKSFPENIGYPISWFYSNHAYDAGLAKRELDFRPRTKIDDGLRNVYNSLFHQD